MREHTTQIRKVRYAAKCVGCGREVRGPTRESMPERLFRHFRNCPQRKRGEVPAVPAPEPSHG